MDAFEFFQTLGAMCKERGAECVGCEMRLFCYTPACAVTDELVALVISLLASGKDRSTHPIITAQEAESGQVRIRGEIDGRKIFDEVQRARREGGRSVF